MAAMDLKTLVRRWVWVKNLEKISNAGVLTSVVAYRYLDHIVSPPVRAGYSALPLTVTLVISALLTLVGNGLEKRLRVYPEFVAWFSGLEEVRRSLTTVVLTGAVAMVAAFGIIYFGRDAKDFPVVTQVIIAFVVTIWIGTLLDVCRARTSPVERQ